MPLNCWSLQANEVQLPAALSSGTRMSDAEYEANKRSMSPEQRDIFTALQAHLHAARNPPADAEVPPLRWFITGTSLANVAIVSLLTSCCLLSLSPLPEQSSQASC